MRSRVPGVPRWMLVSLLACGACSLSQEPAPQGDSPAHKTPQPALSSPNAAALSRLSMLAQSQASAPSEYRFLAGPRDASLWTASNPAQHLRFQLGLSGLLLESSAASEKDFAPQHIQLTRYGRAGAEQQADSPAFRATGPRLELVRKGLTEWYANGPLGLEQGFVFASAPAGNDGELVVELDLGSQPHASLSGPQGPLVLRNSKGTEILRYGELYARDAGGQFLPAGMRLDGSRLVLWVTEGQAKYPVEIDPLVWRMQTQLSPNGGTPTQSALGSAIAVSGTTAVIGVPGADSGSGVLGGAAYVFVRSASGWTQQAKLVADSPAAQDRFGASVALSGDRVVIGAPGTASGTQTQAGAAYVFARYTGSWIAEATLRASDPSAQEHVGTSVAFDGTTAALGAPEYTEAGASNAGAVFLFTRGTSGWSGQGKLVASDSTAGDAFGAAVAVQGSYLAVGAPGQDPSAAIDAGAVYVFASAGGAWSQQNKLLLTAPATGDHFGQALAVDTDKLVVGAPNRQSTSGTASGAAFVFARASGSSPTPLSPSSPAAGQLFGWSVAVSGSQIAVGSPQAQNAAAVLSGAAYTFVQSGSQWNEQNKLTVTTGAAGDLLGQAIGMSGDTLVAGAPSAQQGTVADAGAAYVFRFLLEGGDACTAADQCQSGFCVDGVCCDTACGGSVPSDCQACSVAAGARTNGVCAPLASSVVCRASAGVCDPQETCSGTSAQCPADARSPQTTQCRAAAAECDAAEFCDGTAADCPADVKKGTDVVCRASAGTCDLAENCDGSSNSCPTDARRPASYTCRAASGVCDVAETCDGVSVQCPANAYATASTQCRASAGACDRAENCTGSSAQCPTDQFQASTVECRAAAGDCDVAERCTGSAAACPVDQHATVGTVCRQAAGPCDVAETCTGAATCPANGFAASTTTCRAAAGDCDVAEQCTGSSAACPSDSFLSSSTVCRNASCAQGQQTLQTRCTGSAASCPGATVQPCIPFACGPNACRTTCATASDCAPGAYCDGTACHLQQANGQPCSDNAQCQSDHCVDGYCCNQACGRQCEACDVAEHRGQCTPVQGAPHGNRTACSSDGTVCAGSCDGQHAQGCSYPSVTVQCREPLCSNDVATIGANCQGTGSCPAEQTQACAPYNCSGTQCQGDCVLSTDCVDGYYCAGGICSEKLTAGQACSEPSQCASGFCVDGVCCNEACQGQCQACDLDGAKGTCSPVTGRPHGGRPGCEGLGPCASRCDGTATDHCIYPGASTACSQSACAQGVLTPEAYCNGAGACSTPTPSSCSPYACDSTQCKSSCMTAEDCVQGAQCNSNQCEFVDAGPDSPADAADSSEQEAAVDAPADGPGEPDAPGSVEAGLVVDSVDGGGCGCRLQASASPPRLGWALALLTAAGLYRAKTRRRGRFISEE